MSSSVWKKPRKRGFFILCSVFCLLALPAVCLLPARNGETSTQMRMFRAEDIAPVLRSGDIVCRMGTGFWSGRIRDFSPGEKRYSHVGLLLAENGRFFVIHAEGNDFTGTGTVRMEPLQEFLDSATAYGVYRLKDDDGKCLAESAKRYLGRPFDWRFDTVDHTRIYCTELLMLCLNENYPEVKLYEKEVENGTVIPVDACCSNEWFERVAHSPDSAGE